MELFPPGTILDGSTKIISLIGEGGLGSVYKAEQPELNRVVAVKVLHLSALSDPENRLRFEREARILSSFTSNNIVSVYSFGVLPSGIPYIIMELVEGHTLAQEIEEHEALPWKRAVRMIIQVCSALTEAHEAGIVHRDLKPQNIMIVDMPEPDHIKVLDFGLSRILPSQPDGASQKLTQTGALIGTIYYMSPEICSGQKADHRADIYSLGCILYECLAGRKPLECDNPIGMLHKHREEMPPPLKSVRQAKDILDELELVVFKAIQKEPEQRYQSMAAFEHHLQLLLEGKGAEIQLDNISAGPKSKTRNWVVAVVGVAICLTTALAFFLQNSSKNTAPEFHNLSATTNGRTSDTLRAEQLLEQAQGLKSKGKIESAIQLVTRALGTIDRSYQSSGRSESASKKDLALLQNAAEICQGIDIKNPAEVDGSLSRIEGNDILTLGRSDQSKFHAAEARLCTYFKKPLEASRHYHAAIGTALQAADPVTARKILHEAEEALRPTNLPITTLYLQMAKVLIDANEKRYAEAEKSYSIARKLLDKCYPKGDEDRNRVLGMFVLMDAATDNMPRANQTLDEIFAIAQEIHDGKYKPYMVERRMVSAYGNRRCCADALDSLIVTEGLVADIEPLRARVRTEVLRYRKELDTLNRESP